MSSVSLNRGNSGASASTSPGGSSMVTVNGVTKSSGPTGNDSSHVAPGVAPAFRAAGSNLSKMGGTLNQLKSGGPSTSAAGTSASTHAGPPPTSLPQHATDKPQLRGESPRAKGSPTSSREFSVSQLSEILNLLNRLKQQLALLAAALRGSSQTG